MKTKHLNTTWVVCHDVATDRNYFFNPSTKEVRWELPPNSTIRVGKGGVGSSSSELQDPLPLKDQNDTYSEQQYVVKSNSHSPSLRQHKKSSKTSKRRKPITFLFKTGPEKKNLINGYVRKLAYDGNSVEGPTPNSGGSATPNKGSFTQNRGLLQKQREIFHIISEYYAFHQDKMMSEEARDFRKTISTWLHRRGLSLTLMRSGGFPLVQYPQFFCDSRGYFQDFSIRVMNRCLKGAHEHYIEKRISCGTDYKVEALLHRTLVTFNQEGYRRKTSLLSNPKKCYIFKSLRYNEYIYDRHRTVCEFSCIAEALRMGETPRLQLLEIEEDDAETLTMFSKHKANILREPQIALLFPNHPRPAESDFQFTEMFGAYRIKIVGFDNISHNLNLHELRKQKKKVSDLLGIDGGLCIRIELMHGNSVLSRHFSRKVPFQESVRWLEWIDLSRKISSIPQNAHIHFTIENENKDIASGDCMIINHRRELQQGSQIVPLYLGTHSISLHVEFEKWDRSIHGEDFKQIIKQNAGKSLASDLMEASPTDQERVALHTLFSEAHPLRPKKLSEKTLLHKFRYFAIERKNHVLVKEFLKHVDWKQQSELDEARVVMSKSSKIFDHIGSLEFLTDDFLDPLIHLYATSFIAEMSDESILAILPQLVQALRQEKYHDSPIMRLLLSRMLLDPQRIGQTAFWLVRSEMNTAKDFQRLGLLLEMYLINCGCHLKCLKTELSVMKTLRKVSAICIAAGQSEKRTSILRRELQKVKIPSKFTLPLSGKYLCSGIEIDACKVMGSKQAPLWIVFKNYENADENIEYDVIPIIFKTGDDLRQDMITIQMLKFFDQHWFRKKLDLQMKPYNCVQTSQKVGLIEVVRDSETLAQIQTQYGGSMMGAFNRKTLENYLRRHNSESENFEIAVDTFVHSCAGYCVATYVLGIGDRHPDNIMISNSGRLFHIDFGHFLGNFKSKLGIKRERAPFVFTPQMLSVIGGKDSQTFVNFQETCCKAYNLLRGVASSIIVPFILMKNAGIPELKAKKDIKYLEEMLHLGRSTQEAKKDFVREIKNALKTTTRQLDDMMHNLKHYT